MFRGLGVKGEGFRATGFAKFAILGFRAQKVFRLQGRRVSVFSFFFPRM